MLPRDTLALTPVQRTTPVVATEAIGDPRQQAFQRVLSAQMGQTLQGRVLARLADGGFLVRVADTTARMPLPPGTQPGASLPMKLVGLEPRPTFEVPTPTGQTTLAEATAAPAGAAARGNALAADAAQGAAPGAGAAVIRNAGADGAATRAAPASVLPAAPGDADLSPAARLLGSVLAVAPHSTAPPALSARVPVLAAPSGDPAVLAPALRQALDASGLFYESHVAEWAQGQRSLDQLQGEPQMLRRPGAPTDPATADFINMQLVTQEQAQVQWQGQLWPGQPLQWEIGRDAPGHGSAGAEAGGQWHSRLRLRLPQLGELDALLVLSGGEISLRLSAPADSGALLREQTTRLADALAAAGTPLAALAIEAAAESPHD